MRSYIIQLYLERDRFYNLNRNEVILNSIKKLGYYNYDLTTIKDEYLYRKILNYIIENKLLNSSKCINEIYEEIIKSKEYEEFLNILNQKLERSITLSKFIGTENTEDFYKSCTEYELHYLGY